MRQEARGMPLWHSPRKQARRPGLVTARKKTPAAPGRECGSWLAYCWHFASWKYSVCISLSAISA